jgi:uncharacterized protein (TIGR02246 family)
MTRSIGLAGAAVIIALASVFPGRSAAAGDDQRQVMALYTRFAAAFERKDPDAVMASYVRDDSLFVFDVSPPREYHGWNSYKADYKAFFGLCKGPLHEKISDVAIAATGDLAYTHAIAEISGTLKQGGKFDVVLRVTDVLKKVDGRWLIVQEHLSVPVDLFTGKPDLRSKR